jgi:hypothetical protein
MPRVLPPTNVVCLLGKGKKVYHEIKENCLTHTEKKEKRDSVCEWERDWKKERERVKEIERE